MGTLKKWWPSAAHVLAVGAAYFITQYQSGITTALQHIAIKYSGYTALIWAIWGVVLHWAQSPNQKPPAAG